MQHSHRPSGSQTDHQYRHTAKHGRDDEQEDYESDAQAREQADNQASTPLPKLEFIRLKFSAPARYSSALMPNSQLA